MADSSNTEERGQFGSSLGFIMAAAGSAIGLGNIWRFPYLTGENGGGAFVFVYILCVLLIGLPLLFNEIALGRKSGKNPIGAIRDTGGSKLWQIAGFMCLAVCFFVFSYYSVIAGWTIAYIFTELVNIQVDFQEFIKTPLYVIPLTFLFMLATILIVLGGVSGGIEKASKVLMPLLFIIVIFIAARSVTLEGAQAGIEYYLSPDFSKINSRVVMIAMGQAFFSLGVGWGLMITFGSYLDKKSNIIQAASWIVGMDTMVALLAGLMVFPSLFALLPGKDPASGPALVFDVLPRVFDAMPGGNFIGALFFILLMVAALTSTISMLEVPVSYLIDEKKWNRKRATWTVGIAAMILSVPSALSSIEGNFFADMRLNFLGHELIGFFGIMDFTFGTFSGIVICLVLALYTGWAQRISVFAEELTHGAPNFKGMYRVGWVFFIKWVCPIVISLIILDLVGVFGGSTV
ncbi:sodium-dependent transporter [Algoriphagus lacus]|uniref:Transporter n=1 Tax=Algoriphagus lacus TaxID=2056311 RepID=A0A418PPG1_9BACT|nr:sodium-dependent transporter [Algoriphagus lacus]RIW13967.1 sodium-dependent transporter [Algoriphagus lacus]